MESSLSLENLRGLLNSSSDNIIIVNSQRKIIFSNSQLQTFLGYKHDELKNLNLNTLFGVKNDSALNKLFDSIINGKENNNELKTNVIAKKGDQYEVKALFNQFHYNNSKACAIILSEDGLYLDPENAFRLIVESNPNSIIITDQKGKITLVNTQTEYLFGYSKEELNGAPVEMLIPMRFRDSHVKIRHDMSAKPEPRPMGMGRDLFGLRKDGSEFPVEVGLNPLRTAKGYMMLAVIIDITKRKTAELKLIKEKDYAQSCLECVDVILLALDTQGKVELVNKKGRATLGYDDEELIGIDWFDKFVVPEDKEAQRQNYKQLIQNKSDKRENEEYGVLTKSGEKRLIAWNTSIVEDKAGQVIGTISSGKDVTK